MGATLALVVMVAMVRARGWDDTVVPPPSSGKSGPAAALVFGQGAQIPTRRYAPLAAALQAAVDFPLWVAIPQCISDLCTIPLGLERGVERVLANLTARGTLMVVDDVRELMAEQLPAEAAGLGADSGGKTEISRADAHAAARKDLEAVTRTIIS